MKKEEFIKEYWDYYLMLEKDMLNVKRYVTFNKVNSKTYSIEFIKMYLSIGSEFDVLFRLILNKNKVNINNFKEFIKNDIKYKNILKDKISLKGDYGKDLYPIKDLINKSKDKTNWWRQYNKIKHYRNSNNNILNANLENVLLALSGLFELENYYFNICCYDGVNGYSIPHPYSELFESHQLSEKVIYGYKDTPLISASDDT